MRQHGRPSSRVSRGSCAKTDRQYAYQAPNVHFLKDRTSKRVLQVLASSGTNEGCIDGLFADVLTNALDLGKEDQFVTATRVENHTVATVPREVRRKVSHETGFASFVQQPVHTKQLTRGGEFIFARTNPVILTYTAPLLSSAVVARLPSAPAATRVTIADIDGDNSPDFIYSSNTVLRVVSAAGNKVCEKSFGHDIGLSLVKQFNGITHLAVSEQTRTNLMVFLLDSSLAEIRRFTRDDGCFAVVTNRLGGTFTEQTGMDGLLLDDINMDGRCELVARVLTCYSRYPRYLVAFDYETGRSLWTIPFASGVAYGMATEYDPVSRQNVLLAGCGSCGNGSRLADGSEDDMHCYVRLYGADGSVRWRTEVGGLFVGCCVKFTDMDHSGSNQILASLGSSFEVRETNGLSDVGDVMLFGLDGTLLHVFTNRLSVMSMCTVPNYVAQKENVLITTRGGHVILLDDRLTPILSTNFESASGYDSMPSISGLMNTRYGEFIVIYYLERNPVDSQVGKITGQQGRSDYYNIKILFLDKKTLATRYTIPLAESHLFTGIDIAVHVKDVDEDEEDEVLVIREGTVYTYKLSAPRPSRVPTTELADRTSDR